MSEYVKNFVSAYGIHFEQNKRNREPYEKSILKWKQIESSLDITPDSVIVICGAKNNGKSALLRHLVNNYVRNRIKTKTTKTASNSDGTSDDDTELLDDIDATDEDMLPVKDDTRFAYFIDFDPGQPEITTPGLISAHIIRSSAPELKSPTFLNLARHDCILKSCVGGTNMSVNPRMYIENCRYVYNKVIEHQNQETEKQPIFINTMGHIRNVGLAMLFDVIKICRPTNVVVLNVANDSMRTIYADLSAPALSNMSASFYYETANTSQQLNYKLDIHNLDFAFVDSSSVARKNRTALQLAYLATMPEALYKPIMTMSTKLLSLESVAIYCVSSYPLKVNIVLELLNHSWIHLVELRSSKVSGAKPDINLQQVVEDDLTCTIIDDVGENTLIGCGIISFIDLEAKKLEIITPLSQQTLDSKVDCIIKPLSIQVPHPVLQVTA